MGDNLDQAFQDLPLEGSKKSLPGTTGVLRELWAIRARGQAWIALAAGVGYYHPVSEAENGVRPLPLAFQAAGGDGKERDSALSWKGMGRALRRFRQGLGRRLGWVT